MLDLDRQSQFLISLNLPQYVSFVDESGHSKDPAHTHLCLAGLLAPRSAWYRCNEKWKGVCSDFSLTRPFHMKDFAARRGDFDGWPEDHRRRLLAELMN